MSRSACVIFAATSAVVMVGCGDYTEEKQMKDCTKLFKKYEGKYDDATQKAEKDKNAKACEAVDEDAKKDAKKINDKVNKQDEKNKKKAEKNKDKVNSSRQNTFQWLILL